MRKVRFIAAALMLAAVLSAGYSRSSAQFEGEGCGRCNCMTPNTGKHGVKAPLDDSCPACDCYKDVLD